MQVAASCSISGGVAAMAGATVACPFDVIKTRLQSSHSYLNHSPSMQQHQTQHPAGRNLMKGGGGGPVMPGGQLMAAFHNNSDSINKTFPAPRSMKHNAHFDFKRAMTVLGETMPKSVVVTSGSHPFIFVSGNGPNTKLRGQRAVKSAFNKSALVQVVRSSVQNEGVASLFKGLLPSLAAVAPSKSLYFGFYSVFKDFYSKFFPMHSHGNIICASMSAGFIQATTISPLFMVRTRLQLSTQKVSVKQCCYEIYHAHGVSGFFRGLSATYLGLSETALYFLMYENIKWYLRKEKYLSDNIDAKNSAFVGISAIFSRVVATSCAYPHEVVRTRMRQVDANYSSLLHCFQTIYRKEGTSGFYRGLQVELLKKVPNVAAVFIVYETLMSYFSKQFALQN